MTEQIEAALTEIPYSSIAISDEVREQVLFYCSLDSLVCVGSKRFVLDFEMCSFDLNVFCFRLNSCIRNSKELRKEKNR